MHACPPAVREIITTASGAEPCWTCGAKTSPTSHAIRQRPRLLLIEYLIYYSCCSRSMLPFRLYAHLAFQHQWVASLVPAQVAEDNPYFSPALHNHVTTSISRQMPSHKSMLHLYLLLCVTLGHRQQFLKFSKQAGMPKQMTEWRLAQCQVFSLIALSLSPHKCTYCCALIHKAYLRWGLEGMSYPRRVRLLLSKRPLLFRHTAMRSL